MLKKNLTRRHLIKSLGAGLGGGILFWHPVIQNITYAKEDSDEKKILVILELSGGNDGLNTLVPFENDAYYRNRPKIAIQKNKVRKISDEFGFNPGLAGFERLYKEGKMAIIHGCGYEQPSFSHFTSMAYWHTAAPNSGEQSGWVGRLGDAITSETLNNPIINIDSEQSLAVTANKVVPVVFDNPGSFIRKGLHQEKKILENIENSGACTSKVCNFLSDLAQSANGASALVRDAWQQYNSPVDYGLDPVDLNKIASLIEYGMDTRLYYTSFRNNAFDTHVQQNNLHQRLLTYASDAVAGFFSDMKRIGRENDVTMMIFSEFGRRVPENTSLGTDHGTANHVYVIGNKVRGGHYGDPPSLTELDEGDNFEFTTDFRRVYASIIENWMGFDNSEKILKGKFETFKIFS